MFTIQIVLVEQREKEKLESVILRSVKGSCVTLITFCVLFKIERFTSSKAFQGDRQTEQ